MKILHFDILEGFKKGGITQFENDNLNETYKIYLYKNKMRFDVDGKTIRFVMLDKNKAGQVLTLKKGEASNEIILPVTKELTKIDGIYDAQIIFTKEDGYNEKTIPFKVTIKNDILTDMESELVSKEEYQYLVDRFEEAIRNIEGFKNEISSQLTEYENKINNLNNGNLNINLIQKLNLYQGYIKSSDFSIENNDPNYVYSDFIEVKEHQSIEYKLRGQKEVYIISFYDKLYNPIEGVSTNKDYYSLTEGIANAPINVKYVRFCFAKKTDNGTIVREDNEIYTKQNILNDISKINNDMTYSILNKNLCEDALHVGFIGIDGEILNNKDTNWVYSDFIKVQPFSVLNYTLYGHKLIGSLCFYDSNKKFIKSIVAPSVDPPIVGVEVLPENIHYIKICFASSSNPVGGGKSKCSYSSTEKIKDIVINLKEDVEKIKSNNENKEVIPFVTPYKLYTVCNDVGGKKGHNRNYASAIYLDHLFNDLTEEKHIRFENNSDKIILHSPMEVTDANETNPTVKFNEGQNILIKDKEYKLIGNDIVDSNFNFKHISTLNSITQNVVPKVLCIGDSITYAELAEVNDDEHSQNWAYHLMCKELFMKDNIDNGGNGYDIKFLGHYQKKRKMNYKNVEYDVVTYHEGIRGISLNSYLNGGVDDFKDIQTNKFSLNAWLSKYRTLDDNGNRLTLGDGTGTNITESNIQNIDVCTPTHVLIMLGANGGGTLEQYKELVNIIKTEYPNMIIGITIPDCAGTYFPSLHPNCDEKMTIWNDIGSQGSRHNSMYNLVKMLQEEFCNDTYENQNIYFVPFYFVQPTAESCSMRKVNLPDADILLTHNNLFNASYGWHASTHVNGIGHINWAYQLYSWLKYTIVKNLK